MKTIQMTAEIALHGSNEPDFTRVYSKTVPSDFVASDAALYAIASEIADRYLDAGPVSVSGLAITHVVPSNLPVIGSAVSLDAA